MIKPLNNTRLALIIRMPRTLQRLGTGKGIRIHEMELFDWHTAKQRHFREKGVDESERGR
jgi:hypothetical protein